MLALAELIRLQMKAEKKEVTTAIEVRRTVWPMPTATLLTVEQPIEFPSRGQGRVSEVAREGYNTNSMKEVFA